jgi:hypothetical protein
VFSRHRKPNYFDAAMKAVDLGVARHRHDKFGDSRAPTADPRTLQSSLAAGHIAAGLHAFGTAAAIRAARHSDGSGGQAEKCPSD